MKTTWERPQSHEKRFVALLCYDTTIAVLKPRKSTSDATSDMFGSVQAGDDVVVDGWRDYTMRLPYTDQALRNRQANGRDVPSWWSRVDTFTVEMTEAP